MYPSLSLEIRERLADYLSGAMTLEEFKDWLVGATWDIEACGDRDAIDLTYEIKLILAEQSTPREDEASLRTQLLPHVQQYHFKVICDDPPRVNTTMTSAAQIIAPPMSHPPSRVGT